MRKSSCFALDLQDNYIVLHEHTSFVAEEQ